MLKKKIAVSLMTIAGFIVTPMVSLATAGGFEYWSNFTVPGTSISIPGGQLYHEINGDGYHIDWEAANFASVGNICDSSVRFTYGNGARKSNGAIHKGCSHVGQWKYYPNANFPRGSACAELWAQQWRVLVARQCHYIEG